MKRSKRILSMLLTAVLLFSSLPMTALASDPDALTRDYGDMSAVKISNPTTGSGIPDGIKEGGDRLNSYSWAMTERNGYIYIGTNRAFISSEVWGSIGRMSAMLGQEITQEFAYQVVNHFTYKELPDYTKLSDEDCIPEIIRVDPETGETKVLPLPEEFTRIATRQENSAFRSVVEQDGNLYFGSYGRNCVFLIRVDENDRATVAYLGGKDSTGEAIQYNSLRACGTYDGKQYFGGTNSSLEKWSQDPDKENTVPLFIAEMKDENYDPDGPDVQPIRFDNYIADYEDFSKYADPTDRTVGNEFYDLVTYHDDFYAIISDTEGFAVYKGHPDNDGNEYGWEWELVVDGADPSSPAHGFIAATPVVYKDQLLIGSFSSIGGVAYTAGMLFKWAKDSLTGNKDLMPLSKAMGPLYNLLNKDAKVFRLEDDKLTVVKDAAEELDGKCAVYLWRFTEYHGDLYMTTFDASILANYILDISVRDVMKALMSTLEELLGQADRTPSVMSVDSPFAHLELLKKASAIVTLLSDLGFSTDNTAAEQISLSVAELEKVSRSIATLSEAVNGAADVTVMSPQALRPAPIHDPLCALFERLKIVLGSIDSTSLRMIIEMKKQLNANTSGFDLLTTSDGKEWSFVLDDGFNDKYNYGGRTIITYNDKIYIGTANPFYGSQLWSLDDGTVVPATKDLHVFFVDYRNPNIMIPSGSMSITVDYSADKVTAEQIAGLTLPENYELAYPEADLPICEDRVLIPVKEIRTPELTEGMFNVIFRLPEGASWNDDVPVGPTGKNPWDYKSNSEYSFLITAIKPAVAPGITGPDGEELFHWVCSNHDEATPFANGDDVNFWTLLDAYNSATPHDRTRTFIYDAVLGSEKPDPQPTTRDVTVIYRDSDKNEVGRQDVTVDINATTVSRNLLNVPEGYDVVKVGKINREGICYVTVIACTPELTEGMFNVIFRLPEGASWNDDVPVGPTGKNPWDYKSDSEYSFLITAVKPAVAPDITGPDGEELFHWVCSNHSEATALAGGDDVTFLTMLDAYNSATPHDRTRTFIYDAVLETEEPDPQPTTRDVTVIYVDGNDDEIDRQDVTVDIDATTVPRRLLDIPRGYKLVSIGNIHRGICYVEVAEYEQPDPRPEPDHRPSHGGSDDVTVTFVTGNGYTLDPQRGTHARKDGSISVSLNEGSRIDEDIVPDTIPADDFYKITGWAILNHDGTAEEIDLGTYRFKRDTKVCAICQDIWTPYNDMKADRTDWFYKELRDLSIDGIVGGYADGGYHAENKVTWGAALKLVMLAAGNPAQAQIPGTNHACSGYLALAKAQGVVAADAAIDLYKPITRLEFAQITAKALHMDAPETVNPFTDTTDPSVIALNEAGIINGYGDGRFGPQDSIKRSHIAAIIWRVNQYLEK